MKLYTFLLLGGVIAASAYLLYRKDHTQQNTPADIIKRPEETDVGGAAPAEPDLAHLKTGVAVSVVERHAQAAQAAASVMRTVFDASGSEDLRTDNSDALENMDKDLDDLLK